jgi:hypothetical protein
VDQVRFWNEQYLLEAFLNYNDEWRILGALNYLRHEHSDFMRDALCCSFCEHTEPGSFYIQRIPDPTRYEQPDHGDSMIDMGSSDPAHYRNRTDVAKRTTVRPLLSKTGIR